MIRSQIIIDDISDHLPTCTVLENVNIGMKDKKKILSRKLNNSAITLMCNDLRSLNWDSYLEVQCSDDTNVNNVFDCVHNRICDSVNRHAPLKEKTVTGGKFKNEPWLTQGIRHSSQKLKKLYKLSLEKGSDPSVCEGYVLYRNCLNRVKIACKIQYFKSYCQTYKNNTKYW